MDRAAGVLSRRALYSCMLYFFGFKNTPPEYSRMDNQKQDVLEQYCSALERYSVAVRHFAAALRAGDELAMRFARRAVATARLDCLKFLGSFERNPTGRRTKNPGRKGAWGWNFCECIGKFVLYSGKAQRFPKFQFPGGARRARSRRFFLWTRKNCLKGT